MSGVCFASNALEPYESSRRRRLRHASLEEQRAQRHPRPQRIPDPPRSPPLALDLSHRVHLLRSIPSAHHRARHRPRRRARQRVEREPPSPPPSRVVHLHRQRVRLPRTPRHRPQIMHEVYLRRRHRTARHQSRRRRFERASRRASRVARRHRRHFRVSRHPMIARVHVARERRARLPSRARDRSVIPAVL